VANIVHDGEPDTGTYRCHVLHRVSWDEIDYISIVRKLNASTSTKLINLLFIQFGNMEESECILLIKFPLLFTFYYCILIIRKYSLRAQANGTSCKIFT